MKSKMLVICSSVAVLHLLVGGMIFFGGCASTQEEDQLPPGAYVPEKKKQTSELPPENNPPKFIEPAAPTAQTEVEPVTPPFIPPATPKTVAPVSHGEGTTYVVKKGDTFWKIAKLYGVSEKEIVAYNSSINPSKLKVGQKIVIPPGGKSVSAPKTIRHTGPKAEKPARKTVLAADGKHLVKKGDSFYKIAAMYRVKAEDIATLNGLTLEKPLRVGQTLQIPKSNGKNVGKAKTARTAKKAVKAEAKSAKETKAEKKADDTTAPDTNIPAAPAQTPAAEPVIPAAPAAEPTVPAAPTAVPAAPAAAEPAAPAVKDTTGAALPVKSGEYSATVNEDSTIEKIASQYGFDASELRKLNPTIPADGKVRAGTTIKLP